MTRRNLLLTGALMMGALAGCQGGSSYQKQEAVDLSDLNGVYRDRAYTPPNDGFEHYDYSEFAVDSGKLTFRRLDNETYEAKETEVGSFRSRAGGKSFDFEPVSNLTWLANSQSDVKPLQEFLGGADRILVRRKGDEIHLTRVVGHRRSSQSWVRVGSTEDQTLQKAAQKAGALMGARQAFLDRYKDKELVLFEQIHEVSVSGKTFRHVYAAKDMKDESGNDTVPGSRKELRFKKLKFASGWDVEINGKLKGHSALRIRRAHGPNETGADLLVVSDADSKAYQPADLEGLVSDDGDVGLKIVDRYRNGSSFATDTYRYFPAGATLPTPTASTDPADPPTASDGSEAPKPTPPSQPPRRRTDPRSPSNGTNPKFPGGQNPPAPVVPPGVGHR